MAKSKFEMAVPQITNDLTKFNYLVQAPDEDTALRVKDLIVKPPKDAYEALKKRLLLLFKLTKQERASRILDYPELGEIKAKRMVDELTNYLEDDGAKLSQGMIAATSPGAIKNYLFTYCDKEKKSCMTFLVDTGATVSVFPVSHRGFIRRENSGPLITANGTPISSFGHRDIILTVGNTVLRWPFLLARGTRPILGVNSLSFWPAC